MGVSLVDDKMVFDYSVVRTNFHMGSASGMALKNAEGNYIWNGEEGCELTFEDVTMLVSHQMNARIIESAAKRLKLPIIS